MKSALSRLGIAGTVCVLSLAGYVLSYGVVVSKSEMAAELDRKIEAINTNTSQAISDRAALEELSKEEVFVQDLFVSEEDVAAFVDGLELQGRNQGTTVTVSSISKGGANAPDTLGLSLTVKGTFDSVMRTVGVIEYAPYNLSVSSLVIARDEEKRWHADIKMTVGSVPSRAASVGPQER